MGRHEDAVAAYDKAVDAHTKNAPVIYKKGKVLEALGRNSEADEDEFVVVANSRAVAQNLNGWTLDVSDGRNGGRNQSITLPDFTLGPIP